MLTYAEHYKNKEGINVKVTNSHTYSYVINKTFGCIMFIGAFAKKKIKA